MANYGLAYPYIAKRNVVNGKSVYTDGFKNGNGVNTEVTPNYNEASNYGDNKQVDYVKKFKDADVTLRATTMPLQAADTVFGHTVDQATKKVIYKSGDDSNEVGYGWVAEELEEGAHGYWAAILPRVKFTESAESFQTQGDSITFTNPSISGKAYPNENNEWKIKRLFDTEEEAVAFVKEYLNITDPTPGPVTHTVTQNLTNVTSSFTGEAVEDSTAFEADLTATSGTIDSVTVSMGGTDITTEAWDDTESKVTIASVTGDIVITASA